MLQCEAVHRMPVHPPSVRDGEYFANNLRCWAHLHSVLRHHAYAWCPHHPLPVHPPPVRGGEYFGTSLRWCPHRRHFANNLRCWAHLHQASPHLRCTVLRPNPRRIPVRIRLRRTCGARHFGFVLTHRVLRLTHGVLTTLCRSCSLVLRHHAYAGGLTAGTSPTTYVVGLTCIRPCRSMAKPRCERHSHLSSNSRSPAIRSLNSCSPAIRSGWRVLRQQLTLLGSPPYSCPEFGTGLTPAEFLLKSGFAAPAVHGASALCSRTESSGLRTESSPPSALFTRRRSLNSCSPAIRSGWRVLRQQLTLLGSPAFGTSAPAYAGVLTVGTSPTTYVVGLHCVAPSVKHHRTSA